MNERMQSKTEIVPLAIEFTRTSEETVSDSVCGMSRSGGSEDREIDYYYKICIVSLPSKILEYLFDEVIEVGEVIDGCENTASNHM